MRIKRHITPLLAITGHPTKPFKTQLNLIQIQLPMPESCSAREEEFKTIQLFDKQPKFECFMSI